MTSFAIEIKCLYIALVNIVKTNFNYHCEVFFFANFRHDLQQAKEMPKG